MFSVFHSRSNWYNLVILHHPRLYLHLPRKHWWPLVILIWIPLGVFSANKKAPQMPMFGCRRSAANNISGMSTGFKSLVDITMTWKFGFCALIRSFTIRTSEAVTPPTMNSIRRGWSLGCGRLTFMNILNPVLRRSVRPEDTCSISRLSGRPAWNISSNTCFSRGL